jgi:hypothetical protein
MRGLFEATRGRIPQIWTFINGKRVSSRLERDCHGILACGEGRLGLSGIDPLSKRTPQILNGCLES